MISYCDEGFEPLDENLLNSMNVMPCRTRNIEEHDIINEMVLYYRDGDEIAVFLNESAKAIWLLCDGERTVVDIFREISQRFGALSDSSVNQELLGDLLNTIERLCDIGVLHFS